MVATPLLSEDVSASLSSAEFAALMDACGPFEKNPTLAVAVSGGADSMALMLLTHEWAKNRGGKIIALTVDHGLRAESAQEAKQVHHWCAAKNIEHHILRWSPEILSSAIQAQAREARYRLLVEFCVARGILHLLTAHHQDDQAETLFFRLARGSLIDGLAAMPIISIKHGARLLRPLLSVPKSSLEEFLRARGQEWIRDPSNNNPRYARTLLRREIDGKTSARAAALAQRFGAIRHQLELRVAKALVETVAIFPEGYGTIDAAEFKKLPPELSLRALSNLAITLSGEPYPPRSEKLQRLYNEMIAGKISRRAFAGLLFIHQPRKNLYLVCREPNAVEAPVALESNSSILWDKRFSVTWRGEGEITVRALGPDGIKTLKARAPKYLRLLDKAILLALPSFWRLEVLASIPHIAYQNAGSDVLEADFKPAKPLAALAFSAINTQ